MMAMRKGDKFKVINPSNETITPVLRIEADHCYFCFRPFSTIRGRNIHMSKIHPREWKRIRKKVGTWIEKSLWSNWIPIPTN